MESKGGPRWWRALREAEWVTSLLDMIGVKGLFAGMVGGGTVSGWSWSRDGLSPTTVVLGLLAAAAIAVVFAAVRHARANRAGDSSSEVGGQSWHAVLDSAGARKPLVDRLRGFVAEHVHVTIGVVHPLGGPVVEALGGVFEAAGWPTSTSTHPIALHNPHVYLAGISVSGCNKHLVDGVVECLSDAGLRDVAGQIDEIQVEPDNWKYNMALHRVRIRVGEEVGGG